jgi:hypothetical protein
MAGVLHYPDVELADTRLPQHRGVARRSRHRKFHHLLHLHLGLRHHLVVSLHVYFVLLILALTLSRVVVGLMVRIELILKCEKFCFL